MKTIFILMLFCISASLYANDGGYTMLGDSLHPIDIADVSIDYERLTITYNAETKEFIIEAYIELYNHTGTDIEPLLGFEFENGYLTNWGRKIAYNQIVLLVNDKPQQYTYRFVDNNPGDPGDKFHALLYTPKLVPGKNSVYHHYILYPGFGSMEGWCSYILTTGSRWKDGIIKDFELFVKTTESAMIRIPENRISSFETIGVCKHVNGYMETGTL